MRASILPRNRSRALVANAAAHCLRLPPALVGPACAGRAARTGFARLPGLAADLEIALGIPVPPDAVVECSTVRSLCATLSGAAPPARSIACARGCRTRGGLQTPSVQGHRVADERPPRVADRSHGLPGLDSARRIADTHRSARDLPGPLGSRATFTAIVSEPVRGDLTLPSAGLGHDDWRRLVARTDAVCHAGASINWIAAHDALRDVNVLGTREMLRSRRKRARRSISSRAPVCATRPGPRQ